MKRAISIILAALMILAFAPAAFAATVNWATAPIKEDLGTKVDVLSGKEGKLYGEKPNGVVDKKLTDGTIWSPDNNRKAQYLNEVWALDSSSTAYAAQVQYATRIEKEGGTIEFKLADGSTKKYLYDIQYSDLSCDVDSFQLFWSGETDIINYPIAEWWADSAFDILVSQDGGNTWTVAYESTRLNIKKDADGNDTTEGMQASFWLKDKGGDWEHVQGSDPATDFYWYRTLSADFKQTYKGVTNIAYACVSSRRDAANNLPKVDGFWYCARLTEFNVYEAVASQSESETTTSASGDASQGGSGSGTTAPATGDNAVWFVTAAVAIMAAGAAFFTVRRRRED
jgi:LPXTG-motif cell wall-anchored protein